MELISRSDTWRKFISEIEDIADLEDIDRILNSMPTIEECKEGKWVYGKDEETGEDDLYAWTCSECGGKYPWKPNFCPNCGARMEGE